MLNDRICSQKFLNLKKKKKIIQNKKYFFFILKMIYIIGQRGRNHFK